MPEHAIELALLYADATAASWVIIQGGVPLPQYRAKRGKSGTARDDWQP
jgi:hypothetical protein